MLCKPAFHAFSQLLSKLPGNYLEIGVFDGHALGDLAIAFPNKKLYGIDPFIEDGCTMEITKVLEGERIFETRDYALRNTGSLANVTLFEETSKSFADRHSDQDLSAMDVAWVLIDGSHHYEDVKVDCELAMRLIGNKLGGIVFDDLGIAGVKQAHQEFVEKYSMSFALDLNPNYPGNTVLHSINSDYQGS
jgi:hypothetical protein